MENGEYKVGLDTLFKILQVFELSMSRFFEEPAAAVPDEVPAPVRSEREQLLTDWEELPDDARREVCEFVTFKKMQAEQRRPQWKPDEPAHDPTTDDETDKVEGPVNA